MRKRLHFLLFTAAVSFSLASYGQSQVYFREGFMEGSNFPTSAAEAVPGQYRPLSSGTWYTYGAYRTTGTTGSCPTETGDASHVRFANLNAVTTTNDSAYLITPVVFYGVNTLSFYNGRAARRFSIFKTVDTAATTSNWTFVTLVPADNTACQFTTVTINDANAKRVKMVARSGTDSDIDSVTLTSTSVILPVKFTTFNGTETNGKVKLTWGIATEVNTFRYVIERSIDGKTFTSAGSLNASLASTYNWIDIAPSNGTNFYRINAIDKDGASLYTSILKVKLGSKTTDIIISPNPVRGKQLTLQLGNLLKGTYTLNVYNSTGQTVITQQLNHQGGSASKVLPLPASAKGGMYNLQLSSNGVNISKPFIVE
jgi:hypothetical protein